MRMVFIKASHRVLSFVQCSAHAHHRPDEDDDGNEHLSRGRLAGGRHAVHVTRAWHCLQCAVDGSKEQSSVFCSRVK